MRIEGTPSSDTITAGVVLDAFGRSTYAMSQIQKVIELLKNGLIDDGDIIYTEDFWHPGIESLFYIRDITGIKFKVGCFLHAQSVDEWDFTYSMRYWMRDVERGLSKGYDYVFVTSKILKELCQRERFENIYYVGLPYNSTRLIEQLKENDFEFPEKSSDDRYVLFSSRFDKEKDPHFFMDLVEACSEINFKLVNPRSGRDISNDAGVQIRLDELLHKVDNLKVIDTTNKLTYYGLLSSAEIQFNCAKQDWVSWTLLEALTFNCKVLYPKWRDFPFEIRKEENLYEPNNLKDAKKKLEVLFNSEFDESIKDDVITRHDESWKNYLEIMEVK